jgi:hypothetical protein
LTVMVTGLVPVLAGAAESVAFTVMVMEPPAVGVPLIWQFVASVRPAGMVPAVMTQVYGPVPPETGTAPV